NGGAKTGGAVENPLRIQKPSHRAPQSRRSLRLTFNPFVAAQPSVPGHIGNSFNQTFRLTYSPRNKLQKYLHPEHPKRRTRTAKIHR
ncbi:hypothetical protein L0935_23315, partial [Paracidovorax citrulli]